MCPQVQNYGNPVCVAVGRARGSEALAPRDARASAIALSAPDRVYGTMPATSAWVAEAAAAAAPAVDTSCRT